MELRAIDMEANTIQIGDDKEKVRALRNTLSHYFHWAFAGFSFGAIAAR